MNSEILDKELENFPRLIKYFNSYGDIKESDPKRQEAQIEEIEKLINQVRSRLDNSKQPVKYPDPNHFYYSRHFQLTVLVHFAKKIDTALASAEDENLSQLLVLLNEIAFALSSSDKLVINVESLSEHLFSIVDNEENYKKAKWYHDALNHKIDLVTSSWKSNNYNRVLSVEILAAINRYQKSVKYSPPSYFDLAFNEYIHNHPKITKMLGPASQCLADPNMDFDSAFYMIDHFLQDIYKALNVDMKGPLKHIIFTSLIRLLFTESSVYGNGLNKHQEIDGKFLIRCHRFANQTVRDLNLSDEVLCGFTQGLHIRALFKTNKVGELKSLETILNPIDLMYQIYSVLQEIQKAFAPGKTISFDDMFTLLLACISLNPPSNAYSIAKFIAHWDKINYSNIISLSKNYYIAAIDQLMKNNPDM
ncbi:vacuolar sorting protein 9 (VPS9) domain family [Trichomonas vaginalis G3]|nr:vacuolar sorting protein 9 (VPS9) domain family [Trichomonas vaginalis G3]KAI5525154.1 vacuolar sorting protein 9 (VPS9) domain family [Trichomonas vaginalis G3]